MNKLTLTESQEKRTYMASSVPLILFLVFLVLKLTKKINWSWWWVTAPLWGGALIGGGVYGYLWYKGSKGQMQGDTGNTGRPTPPIVDNGGKPTVTDVPNVPADVPIKSPQALTDAPMTPAPAGEKAVKHVVVQSVPAPNTKKFSTIDELRNVMNIQN